MTGPRHSPARPLIAVDDVGHEYEIEPAGRRCGCGARLQRGEKIRCSTCERDRRCRCSRPVKRQKYPGGWLCVCGKLNDGGT